VVAAELSAPARAQQAAATNEKAQVRQAAEAQKEAARRDAQARAEQRERDRARLNKANQTLDDLLK
jgi:hypothetical protein